MAPFHEGQDYHRVVRPLGRCHLPTECVRACFLIKEDIIKQSLNEWVGQRRFTLKHYMQKRNINGEKLAWQSIHQALCSKDSSKQKRCMALILRSMAQMSQLQWQKRCNQLYCTDSVEGPAPAVRRGVQAFGRPVFFFLDW